MALQSSNRDYYDKMQELEERLKRSEEERMMLQRQFDLLLQANHEKERARVSAVEARYKRFLDEDKRRRDRNSSLLQALDRIDSHTASLAAKTERMRALRKHYEAFIAHSYPGWHIMERSYYPLAPLSPVPNVMARVSEITGFDTEPQRCLPDPSDYSETQYHALPSVTGKPFYPLASSLCRSDLSIASREENPVGGRSLYRTGSAAVRSASLSPSRVRDLTNLYDSDKRASSSLRNHDPYPSSKSPDVGLSPRLRNEFHYSKKSDFVTSPRPIHYQTSTKQAFSEEKHTPYRPFSSTNHHFLDSDHGTSDFEVEQNTSGDLLNLSNLSLSDDGFLNESDLASSPPAYSGSSLHYNSPRNSYSPRKNTSISLPSPHTSLRHQSSPRDAFIPKRSGRLSPRIFPDSTPKSILSPRSLRTDIPLPASDSVYRILPNEDFSLRRHDAPISPRRQTSSWQTLRPSYLQPPRSSIRRSVTFTEPEFESPYAFRDEDVGLYGGSYGSLRRHSPSLPTSSWESSDHERFLREKQGREKDAFREKIERLKELIQENKDQELGMSGSYHDISGKSSLSRPKSNTSFKDYEDQENATPRSSAKDWKASQSRRSSLAMELGPDSGEPQSQSTEQARQIDRQYNNEDLDLNMKNHLKDDESSFSDTISDKEHWSGNFSEKDEDMQEEGKSLEKRQDLEPKRKDKEDRNDTQYTFEQSKIPDLKPRVGDPKFEEHESFLTIEASNPLEKEESVLGGSLFANIEHPSSNEKQVEQLDHPNEKYQEDIHIKEKESFDFTLQNPLLNQTVTLSNKEENLLKQAVGLDNKPVEPRPYEQEIESNQEKVQQPPQEERENFDAFRYEGDQNQSDWMDKNENKVETPQQNIPYNYEQDDKQLSSDYEEQQQNGASNIQEPGFETYSADIKQDDSSYDQLQTNVQQQPQTQENYNEGLGYESYQEPQHPPSSGGGYQEFSEDPNQYQQNYQTYLEDQQYGEQQDPNYASQEQNNYQYTQDPNKTQYEYEGQDYNYQENQDSYRYSQDPDYQQDPTYQTDQQYQQEPAYQPDQSYQPDQPYQQDQIYQQDQAYEQDPSYQQEQTYQQNQDFQQGQQFQETDYQGSQQYEGYQPAIDELSEDTTPSADSNYQTQYQAGDAADQQQTLEQYRALLGADPSSEPAYSDSSEIENQMAAVVAQGGTTTSSLAETSQPTLTLPAKTASQPPQPSTAASQPSTVTSPTPTVTSPPSTAPSPSPTPAKGKAGAKKRPQLTRKQSSITPDSANGKQQQGSNLPKMPESSSDS